MTEEQYQWLLRGVRQRAGDAFRTAFQYTADDWSVLPVREDLRTEELRSVMPDVIENAREDEVLVDDTDYPTAGTPQATVELYEEAVLLHFRTGGETGVLLSLDRNVAEGLGQFVAELQSTLESS
jgi:hypothetical protein